VHVRDRSVLTHATTVQTPTDVFNGHSLTPPLLSSKLAALDLRCTFTACVNSRSSGTDIARSHDGRRQLTPSAQTTRKVHTCLRASHTLRPTQETFAICRCCQCLIKLASRHFTPCVARRTHETRRPRSLAHMREVHSSDLPHHTIDTLACLPCARCMRSLNLNPMRLISCNDVINPLQLISCNDELRCLSLCHR
jgi:hypothetical protein